MRVSDMIAEVILAQLEQSDGTAQIQRNLLAQELGCVPSQINYVLTSRFTPEQGYRVESRRGGGGYILITRAHSAGELPIMHLINSLGDSLDEGTCRAHLTNLQASGLLNGQQARMLLSALSAQALREVPQEVRDKVRCTILKQMLIACIP